MGNFIYAGLQIKKEIGELTANEWMSATLGIQAQISNLETAMDRLQRSHPDKASDDRMAYGYSVLSENARKNVQTEINKAISSVEKALNKAREVYQTLDERTREAVKLQRQ